MKRKGKFIVLIGPDGSGKSTIADAIIRKAEPQFGNIFRFHWRPEILPTPGRSRRSTSDAPSETVSTAPPTQYKYGTFISLIRFLYFLVDFTAGYWLKIRPKLNRGDLVIGERWYFDVIAHPQRYAFKLPRWFLFSSGILVPKPDATIFLCGDPDIINKRKPELSSDEIRCYITELDRAIPQSAKPIHIKTDTTVYDTLTCLDQALNKVYAGMNRPTRAWSFFPSRNRPRILISEQDSISNALRLFQAYTLRSKIVKSIYQHLPDPFARWILPTAHSTFITQEVNSLLSIIHSQSSLTDTETSVYIGSEGRLRKITFQFSNDKKPCAYVKCANTPDARSAIKNEANALTWFQQAGKRRFQVPHTIFSLESDTHSILATSAPPRSGINHGLDLDSADISFLEWMSHQNTNFDSLSNILSATCFHHRLADINKHDNDSETLTKAVEYLDHNYGSLTVLTHACHGDYAPWNRLVLDNMQLYVFDWEYHRLNVPALFDLLHFIYMPLQLINKAPSEHTVQQLFDLSLKHFKRLTSYSDTDINHAPVYILYYLTSHGLREHFEHGSTNDYTKDCIGITMQRLEKDYT